MELESLAGRIPGDPVPFPAEKGDDGVWVLDPVPLLSTLGTFRARGHDVAVLSARFHESVAEASADLAARLCGEHALDTVALGGGCFQNARLLSGVTSRLERVGLRVLVPQKLGPNDGAVSYGQAVVASARMAH
jgi:hydrogenase maturation protein HypF